MSNDKYNRAIPELLDLSDKMTDWEKDFMRSMTKQYEGSGTYSIGQRNILDKMISAYIDGIVPDRSNTAGDSRKDYGPRVVTQKGTDGWHVYVDSVHVGIPVTYKEQMIVGTFIKESLTDLDRIMGGFKGTRELEPAAPVPPPAPAAPTQPASNDEGFNAGGKSRF